MGFQSIQTQTRGKCREDQIRVTVDKAGENADTLGITIGKKVLSSLRWVLGDRVDILVDHELRAVLIKRQPCGPYKLCPQTYTKGADYVGTVATSRTKTSTAPAWLMAVPGKGGWCPAFKITGDGIMFSVGETATGGE